MLLRTTLSLLIATTVLTAQNDFAWDKVTSGRLGSTLQLQATGAPGNQIILFLLSFNAGPTPLIVLDGVDTRFMQIGPDLLDLLSFSVTSPTGSASYALGLPIDPSWNDLVVHWQCAMLPLAGPTFFGQISNDIVTQFGDQDTGILAPATMLTARAFAASFADTDNNAGAGDVVIAGGGVGNLTSATGLATSEVWDYRHMQMVAGPSMATSRALHVAVTLNDGRTLIIGGVDNNSVIQNSCELYNPATNSFAATGSMSTARMLHAACRLADGRVMVVGGASALDLVNLTVTALNSVEIYNPATGTWSGANTISGPRLAPALTLLSNNQVMVSGGVQVSYFVGVPISANSINTVQRWNPATGTWTSGPNMPYATAFHHFNQVTLADNRVLITGGINVPTLFTVPSSTPVNGGAVYNPATNTWATVNLTAARALHSATRLADGRVVVCGGAQGTLDTPVSIAGVEVFNPTSNTWAAAPALTAPRAGHAAALTPDGTLVLFGGQDAVGTTGTIETLRF